MNALTVPKLLTLYEKKLLCGWEEVHKKGQLTLWVLLALRDKPMHMAEIKKYVADITNNTITVDDKSMYRALRRYCTAKMVTFELTNNKNGPDRKLYHLTRTGHAVLAEFCVKNIKNIFYRKRIQRLITGGKA